MNQDQDSKKKEVWCVVHESTANTCVRERKSMCSALSLVSAFRVLISLFESYTVVGITALSCRLACT